MRSSHCPARGSATKICGSCFEIQCSSGKCRDKSLRHRSHAVLAWLVECPCVSRYTDKRSHGPSTFRGRRDKNLFACSARRVQMARRCPVPPAIRSRTTSGLPSSPGRTPLGNGLDRDLHCGESVCRRGHLLVVAPSKRCVHDRGGENPWARERGGHDMVLSRASGWNQPRRREGTRCCLLDSRLWMFMQPIAESRQWKREQLLDFAAVERCIGRASWSWVITNGRRLELCLQLRPPCGDELGNFIARQTLASAEM